MLKEFTGALGKWNRHGLPDKSFGTRSKMVPGEVFKEAWDASLDLSHHLRVADGLDWSIFQNDAPVLTILGAA